MSFLTHKDRAGQSWLVDPDGIKQLIRSYVRSQLVFQRSKLVSERQNMGPLGVFFPLSIVTVQTNFDGLGNAVDKCSRHHIDTITRQIDQSGLRALHTLVGFRNATINLNNAFRDMQVSASQQTNDAVNRVMSRSTAAMKVTRGIRDLSTDVLMVGATFLSGGMAVAAIGGTSALKGSFTFEDKKLSGASTSDAIGSATIEASTDLIVGVISFGEGNVVAQAVKTGTKEAAISAGTLVVIGAGIDGTSEFAKATVDGETVKQGLIAAGTRAGLHILLAGLDLGTDHVLSDTRLSKLSFPITVTSGSQETASITKIIVSATASSESDAVVQALSTDTPTPSPDHSAAWHQSLARTHLPLGGSSLVYVEQYAIRPARR